jgi:hypothetical protein
MKYLPYLFFILLFSCSKTERVNNDVTNNLSVDSVYTNEYEQYLDLENYLVASPIDSTQLQLITDDCVVLIYPSEAQIKKLMEENSEEDYATIADDFNFYHSLAIEKIDSLHVKAISTSRPYLKFAGKETSWTLDIRKEGMPEWNIIFFKKEAEPKIFNAIDITTQDITSFFKLAQE